MAKDNIQCEQCLTSWDPEYLSPAAAALQVESIISRKKHGIEVKLPKSTVTITELKENGDDDDDDDDCMPPADTEDQDVVMGDDIRRTLAGCTNDKERMDMLHKVIDARRKVAELTKEWETDEAKAEAAQLTKKYIDHLDTLQHAKKKPEAEDFKAKRWKYNKLCGRIKSFSQLEDKVTRQHEVARCRVADPEAQLKLYTQEKQKHEAEVAELAAEMHPPKVPAVEGTSTEDATEQRVSEALAQAAEQCQRQAEEYQRAAKCSTTSSWHMFKPSPLPRLPLFPPFSPCLRPSLPRPSSTLDPSQLRAHPKPLQLFAHRGGGHGRHQDN